MYFMTKKKKTPKQLLSFAEQVLKNNANPVYPIFGVDKNGLFVIEGRCDTCSDYHKSNVPRECETGNGI